MNINRIGKIYYCGPNTKKYGVYTDNSYLESSFMKFRCCAIYGVVDLCSWGVTCNLYNLITWDIATSAS